jgi:hypothetical protein
LDGDVVAEQGLNGIPGCSRSSTYQDVSMENYSKLTFII